MNINKLLKFSSDAGQLMLQSGGETYRVEETVSILLMLMKLRYLLPQLRL